MLNKTAGRTGAPLTGRHGRDLGGGYVLWLPSDSSFKRKLTAILRQLKCKNAHRGIARVSVTIEKFLHSYHRRRGKS